MEKVVQEFARFPGIGKKTAQRLGFHLLTVPEQNVGELAAALLALKQQVTECSLCHNIAEGDLCQICRDPSRDHGTVCVVERVIDVLTFERMGEYRGRYHVLGGVISPLDGVSPGDLRLDDLIAKLSEIEELIIATHPSIEGDTTAMYIAQQAEGQPVKITRLARGLPMGSKLEFADEATLSNAYTGRVKM